MNPGAASEAEGFVVVTCENATRAVPYLEALVAGGLAPARLRLLIPDRAHEGERLGAQAAGVMLCGGPDVEPWRYGEAALPAAGLEILPSLDALELDVLAGARAAAVPVWGVCRGLQTLNVFLGGTLYQDLPLQAASPIDHEPPRPVDALSHAIATTASLHPLAELLRGLGTNGPGASRPGEGEAARVNSRHHQAVKDLAPGLEAIASSPDGVLEAFVHSDPAWWVQAVQWHPENLLAIPAQLELWRRFAARVGAPA